MLYYVIGNTEDDCLCVISSNELVILHMSLCLISRWLLLLDSYYCTTDLVIWYSLELVAMVISSIQLVKSACSENLEIYKFDQDIWSCETDPVSIKTLVVMYWLCSCSNIDWKGDLDCYWACQNVTFERPPTSWSLWSQMLIITVQMWFNTYTSFVEWRVCSSNVVKMVYWWSSCVLWYI